MESHVLSSLDGRTLFGFLAALGAFKAVCRARPHLCPRLSWQTESMAWRPVLSLSQALSPEALSQAVWEGVEQICRSELMPICERKVRSRQNGFGFKDVCKDWDSYRQFSARAVELYLSDAGRVACDWASALSNEAVLPEGMNALVLQRGQGHRYFLHTVLNLTQALSESPIALIQQTLFGAWEQANGLAGTGLDAGVPSAPAMGHPHAGDGSGCVVAAEVLAAIGITFYAVYPTAQGATTGAFHEGKAYWCLWEMPMSEDGVSGLLDLLVGRKGLNRALEWHVSAVYCAEVGIGVVSGSEYYREVSPSFRVM